MDILSQYVIKNPENQNILDIFAGEWSSSMPVHSGLHAQPGLARLFEDHRLQWAAEALGGLAGLKVLELGPLEGGHSYMLQQMGVEEVLAIEANSRAFLKCLCIKEIFCLNRIKFKLGDFVAFLEQSREKFDAALASGVLYHMAEPVHLLGLLARSVDKLYLWTHYYDHAIIQANPNLKHKFDPPEILQYHEHRYEACQQSYKDALEWNGFCGGPIPTSKWLSKESLLRCLADLGFSSIHTRFEQPDHPNGPALALCAIKS